MDQTLEKRVETFVKHGGSAEALGYYLGERFPDCQETVGFPRSPPGGFPPTRTMGREAFGDIAESVLNLLGDSEEPREVASEVVLELSGKYGEPFARGVWNSVCDNQVVGWFEWLFEPAPEKFY